MVKKGLFVLLGWLCAISISTAATIDKTQPYQMMKLVSEQTFTRLKAEQDKIKQNPDYLKTVVEEELLDYVNVQYAALKLLGPNLKGAKRADVMTFIDAFRGYLVRSYAQVLTQYTDQVIEFGPEIPVDEDRRITTVKVDIIDSPRPNIKLEFKLRREKDTGEWLAFDMVAEGVSMLSSKQSEWSGKLRKDGILAVAKDLEEQAKRPIALESNQ
ncbi:phospholipid-binding protein MlaC [Vibrio sp.]|uniref:phospholipid-binding protein MlaC n=1 Tax=Vibrio sp. TaxID=678 RepID=UPI003D0A827C